MGGPNSDPKSPIMKIGWNGFLLKKALTTIYIFQPKIFLSRNIRFSRIFNRFED